MFLVCINWIWKPLASRRFSIGSAFGLCDLLPACQESEAHSVHVSMDVWAESNPRPEEVHIAIAVILSFGGSVCVDPAVDGPGVVSVFEETVR